MGNDCCTTEAVAVEEPPKVKKKEPKKPEPKVEKKPEPKPEPVKVEKKKEVSQKDLRHANIGDLKKSLSNLPNDGFYDVKSIQSFIFDLEYFQKFIPCSNIFICDFDDRDSSKDLFITACKTNEEAYEGKTANRETSSEVYGIKEVKFIEKCSLVGDTFPALVFPVVDEEGGVYRLLIFGFSKTPEGIETIIAEDAGLWKEVLQIYSRVYLLLDIRFKYCVIAEEACEFLKFKLKKDYVHVGFLFKSTLEKEKADGVNWVAGTHEDHFVFDKQLLGLLESKKLESDTFAVYSVSPKVEVFGEPLIGVIKFEKALSNTEESDVKETIEVLEKCVELSQDEEEKDEIDDEDGSEDLDEGELSDDEDEDENSEEFRKLFFECMLGRIERRLRKLDRKDKAELLSFSNPPKGVFEINKAILYLLGVSRTSLKDWQRCRLIMKTKYRFNFKALKELDFAKVKLSRRQKAEKILEGLSYHDIKEINYTSALLYVFSETILLYGKVLAMKEEDNCRFKNRNHYKVVV